MNALKRGCAELAVIWAAAGYALYTYFHSRFEPPGDLWGAVIGGLLVSWSWGAIRNMFGTLARKKLFTQGEMSFQPTDGRPYAAVGSAIPLGEPLRSPFRNQECLVYDYSVFTRKLVTDQSSDSTSDRVDKKTYMGGYAMCPFAVRTSNGNIRILGFAIPEAFPAVELAAAKMKPRILEYVKATRFEEEQGLGIMQKWNELKHVLGESEGAHRYDWKNNKLELVLDEDTAFMTEQCLPVGAQVCVIGDYSAEKGGLINDHKVGGMEVLPGGVEDAIRVMRRRIVGQIIAALLLAVAGTIGAYGVLQLRETRSSEILGLNRERFKAGVRDDDVAKVAKAIEHGISPDPEHSDIDDVVSAIRSKPMFDLLVRSGFDVNRPMKSGSTPLTLAVSQHRCEFASWLIDAGANVNAQDAGWGTTALEKALDKGDDEMIRLLVARNAKAVYVTAKNGTPIAPHGSPEFAAVVEYLQAFTRDDVAALREATDNWPPDFFDSFSRGLYRNSKSGPATLVRGFSNGEAATLVVTCPRSAQEEIWTYTLVNRNGKWKVRRASLDL